MRGRRLGRRVGGTAIHDKNNSFQPSTWILQDLLHTVAGAQSHWEDCGRSDDGSDAEKPRQAAQSSQISIRPSFVFESIHFNSHTHPHSRELSTK